MDKPYKKKYFTFYSVYDQIMENLDDHRKLIFFKTLCKVQFEGGEALKNALLINFNDQELSNCWDIVIDQLSKRDRNSKDYKNWRSSVYERDNYTCRHCQKDKCKLNAHHIVRWVDSIEMRFDINNGITLCIECHKKEHRVKGN